MSTTERKQRTEGRRVPPPTEIDSALYCNQKLVLIVDLDKTVVESGEFPRATQLEGVQTFMNGKVPLQIRVRPFAHEFLRQAQSAGFICCAYTQARHDYALQVLQMIDPNHSIFEDRLMSRTMVRDPVSKQEHVSPKDLSHFNIHNRGLCLILDDCPSVWLEEHHANMIVVHPYSYLSQHHGAMVSSLPAASTTTTTQDAVGVTVDVDVNGNVSDTAWPPDHDSVLVSLLPVVQAVHALVYGHSDATMATFDVRTALSWIMRSVLHRNHVAVKFQSHDGMELASLITRLGGHAHFRPDAPCVTHIVVDVHESADLKKDRDASTSSPKTSKNANATATVRRTQQLDHRRCHSFCATTRSPVLFAGAFPFGTRDTLTLMPRNFRCVQAVDDKQ